MVLTIGVRGDSLLNAKSDLGKKRKFRLFDKEFEQEFSSTFGGCKLDYTLSMGANIKKVTDEIRKGPVFDVLCVGIGINDLLLPETNIIVDKYPKHLDAALVDLAEAIKSKSRKTELVLVGGPASVWKYPPRWNNFMDQAHAALLPTGVNVVDPDVSAEALLKMTLAKDGLHFGNDDEEKTEFAKTWAEWLDQLDPLNAPDREVVETRTIARSRSPKPLRGSIGIAPRAKKRADPTPRGSVLAKPKGEAPPVGADILALAEAQLQPQANGYAMAQLKAEAGAIERRLKAKEAADVEGKTAKQGEEDEMQYKLDAAKKKFQETKRKLEEAGQARAKAESLAQAEGATEVKAAPARTEAAARAQEEARARAQEESRRQAKAIAQTLTLSEDDQAIRQAEMEAEEATRAVEQAEAEEAERARAQAHARASAQAEAARLVAEKAAWARAQAQKQHAAEEAARARAREEARSRAAAEADQRAAQEAARARAQEEARRRAEAEQRAFEEAARARAREEARARAHAEQRAAEEAARAYAREGDRRRAEAQRAAEEAERERVRERERFRQEEEWRVQRAAEAARVPKEIDSRTKTKVDVDAKRATDEAARLRALDDEQQRRLRALQAEDATRLRALDIEQQRRLRGLQVEQDEDKTGEEKREARAKRRAHIPQVEEKSHENGRSHHDYDREQRRQRSRSLEEQRPRAAPRPKRRAQTQVADAPSSREQEPPRKAVATSGSRMLVVKSLPRHVEDKMLSVLFGQLPGFQEVQMAVDRSVAVVGYDQESEATQALNLLKGFELLPGVKLDLSFAPPE